MYTHSRSRDGKAARRGDSDGKKKKKEIQKEKKRRFLLSRTLPCEEMNSLLVSFF